MTDYEKHARPRTVETASDNRRRDAHPSRLPLVHYGAVGQRHDLPPVRDNDVDDDDTPRTLPDSTVRLLGIDPRAIDAHGGED